MPPFPLPQINCKVINRRSQTLTFNPKGISNGGFILTGQVKQVAEINTNSKSKYHLKSFVKYLELTFFSLKKSILDLGRHHNP